MSVTVPVEARLSSKPHYSHIALARGISIVLVAFGHSALADMYIAADALGVVRMPFFFLLAGLFFTPAANRLHYCRKKSIVLLSPYFFVLTAIGIKQWLSGGDLLSYISGMLYGNGQTIAWTPLWFLPHLFLLYSLAALTIGHAAFQRLTRWQQYLFTVVWLVVAGIVLNSLQLHLFSSASGLLHTGLPWGADFAPVSLGYFALGYLLRQQFVQAEFNLIQLLGFTAVFCLLVYLLNAAVDFNLRLYTPALLLPAIILPGCFMLLQFALLLSQVPLLNSAFTLCGRYSLYILIFHVFFQQILSRHLGSAMLWQQFAVLLGSIVFSVVAGWCIRRVVLLRYCFEPLNTRIGVTRQC